MKQTRKINSEIGLAILIIASVVSILILTFASTTGYNAILQAIVLLLSMGLLFYSTHPLGHYFVARLFGITTDYFFLGGSDFGKSELKPMRIIGNILPTIGTKLNKSKLELLAPREKGYVFGSGVFLSNILIGIELVYVLISGFSFLAILLGAIFFVGSLGLEFFFSTKVGDLSKMKNAMRTVK